MQPLQTPVSMLSVPDWHISRPFWNAESLFHDNRFNGKESQSFAGLPYLDYGARMYDPSFRLSWNAIDPMAEKYWS
ncbi:MAG: hypothetical protein NC115_05775 [Bacteroidales bacterium]|nr:hypothetical protein [Bacteroides sp.]MCM1197912.1 hypothetical protein [Clostridium sp.]MCM1502158.1 hypothetical protein [Bacteroidales bacterium]